MRLTTSRSVATLATLTLTLGAVSFFLVVWAARSPAQTWPQFLNNLQMFCQPTGFSCASCPGVAGCTSQVPAQWSMGVCQGPAQINCRFSLFNCGPQFFCASGLPTGLNCPANQGICQ